VLSNGSGQGGTWLRLRRGRQCKALNLKAKEIDQRKCVASVNIFVVAVAVAVVEYVVVVDAADARYFVA